MKSTESWYGTKPKITTRRWPGYRTVWRWHFYAGLFCIPFVIWLSITGSIYLFKPQIEAWLDRPYDRLPLSRPATTAEAQVMAALASLPGANLHYYQLPKGPESAVQVVVGRGPDEYRVYVHPQTLNVLKLVNEDRRPMNLVFHLHGELLMGDGGSMLVELAASWAIVMILTGLYLWWPRNAGGLGGILYPRLKPGKRIFWRDLHAVTGVWISFFVLFLLVTGLPWASSWGKYLAEVRALTHASGNPDWAAGSSAEIEARLARNTSDATGIPSGHADHAAHGQPEGSGHMSYAPIDKIVSSVSALHLAYPVLISPPSKGAYAWTAKSDAQNRPLQVNLALDPLTGRILQREDFNQRHWIDRAVEIGVAAHEGQLFGWLNQLLGVCTAIGLIVLSISSATLWSMRRRKDVLGAPPTPQTPEKLAPGFIAAVTFLGVFLPLLGVSIIAVKMLESLMLRRIPWVRDWLGLTGAGV